MLEEDGQPELAVQAFNLALQQWERLGKEGQIASVRGALELLRHG